MASWTDQSTDSLLPGEPWTSAKALACFENPVAIAEGAAGAPKISTEALDANSINENAMKVELETRSGTLTPAASALIEIPGNLVFFPRVTGGSLATGFVEGVMSQGHLRVRNTDPDNSHSYTVTWYRIIP